MAPISSGSSTWTSSGIHFSLVSMATGMGPSSSGSQATVASVVTSTLLAGLGVGGGVISSLPSSVGPTQAPPATQNPTTPPRTEQKVPEGAETDKPSEDNKATEEEKEEGDEGEGEQEEEEDERKKKTKNSPDVVEKQANSTVAEEPLVPTPSSTAKEKGTKVIENPEDDRMMNTERKPTETNEVSTQDFQNDTAEMQIPESATLSPKTGADGKSHWPFSVYTGK